MKIDEKMLENLRSAAKDAALRAYCPYSRYHVGAAVLTESGQIYSGCNVENASYGLSICAERNAIFAMAAAGDRAIRLIVVYTPSETPTTPCGACRQVIYEFGSNASVLGICDGPDVIGMTMSELLPAAFALDKPT